MGKETNVLNFNALTAVVINNSAKTYASVIRLEEQVIDVNRRLTNLEGLVYLKRAPTQ
jgi:hypothetical protein